jgi:hypothetical protein
VSRLLDEGRVVIEIRLNAPELSVDLNRSDAKDLAYA